MWQKVLSVILSVMMVMPGTMMLTTRRALACNPCCIGCQPECSASQKVKIAPDENGEPWCFDAVDGHALLPCEECSKGSCHSVGVPDGVLYNPANPMAKPGLPASYTSMNDSYATLSATYDKLFIMLGKETVTFKKVNGVWQYVMNDDLRGPAHYKLIPADQNPAMLQDFVVQEQGSGLLKKYTFKGFDQLNGDDGRLWKIEQGGGTIEYARDTQGRVTASTDAYGRTSFYFYTGAGYLEYIVRCGPRGFTNMNGPVTKFVYDGTRITEVWEGTIINSTVGPNYLNPALYNWKKTLYWFDGNGRLTYEVGPEEYSQLPANPTEQQIAAKARLTYLYDANTGKVNQVIGGSCASCGGSTSGGVKYADHGSVVNLYGGNYPDARNTPTQQVDTQHVTQPTLGGAVTWNTDEIVQTNNQGQLIVRLKVMDFQNNSYSMLVEKDVYSNADDDSAGRLQKVYYYEATSASLSDQALSTAVTNATLKRVVKYEYDGNGFIQYEKVSPDDATWTTKHRWDRNASGQVTTEYVYKDNNTSYATDYTYDASGRLTQKQEPTVTVNLDKAGGQNYRPTTTYTYTSWGDLDSETDPSGVVTKYLYGYNDGVDNDGNGQVDDSAVLEGFNRTKVIVDYGDATHLNLTTTYEWTNIYRQWQLTSMTDARGKTWTYTVDSWKRVTQATSPLGYTTNYTYDLNNRLLSAEKKDPQANLLAKSGMTYDVFGNVLMEQSYCKDTNGNLHYYATCYHRDNGGHLRKVWKRVYDAMFAGDSGGPSAGTKLGDVIEYSYQHTTGLVAEVYQGARSTAPVKTAAYHYDIFGDKTKYRRYRNNDNTYNDLDFGYDFQRRLASVTGPGNAYTAIAYDARDMATETQQRDTNAEGALLADVKVYYDEAGRKYKTEVVNPDHTNFSRTTNYYFDKGGRLCGMSDAGSHQTNYDYDTAGRMYKVTDPLGNVALYTLDPVGSRVLTMAKHRIDPTPTYRTERAFTWFDDDGRRDTLAVFGTNSPGQNWNPPTEPPKYDYANWPTKPTASASDKLVTQYAYGYDGMYGQFVEITDAAGTANRSFRDLLGRTTRAVEDYGTGRINRVTTCAFDVPDGNDYYDSITAENGSEADQVTKYWRTDGVSTSRVTKVTYPDGGNDYVTYAFRRDGTPSTRVDQRGWTTTYTCDAAGRVTAEAVTGTGVLGTKNASTTYDALGRVTEIKDDNGRLDGQNPYYDYSKVTYSYAWASNSAEMTVTETNYLAGSQTGTVTSIYNADGERTKVTYPNSRYVTYTYDDDHRLYQISDDSNPAVVLAGYDYKGGYLQDRKLNGDAFRLTYKDANDLDGYDAFGRPAWMRQYRVSNGMDVVKLAYSYDYVRTPKYQQDLVNTTANDELYGTDTLHRLTAFKRGTLNQNKDDVTDNPIPREQSWTLQHVGNWNAVASKTNGNNDAPYDTRTHNTVNQITAITPQGQNQFSVTNDAAGNLSVLPDRTDTTKADRYTYDYRNRLVKVEHSTNYDQQTPTWSTVVDYLYDGLNRRALKDLASGADVLYLYDGWRCIEEREQIDGNWQAVRQFVFGGLYLDEVLLFDKDTDADGNCTDAGGSTRYLYAANNNFNAMALTDKDGAVVEKVKYDPYGQPMCIRVSDGDVATVSHFGNPFLFQGQRIDPETGLYCYRYRTYSVTLGRFLQRDPIRESNSTGLYGFVACNPILSVDPYGLKMTTAEKIALMKKILEIMEQYGVQFAYDEYKALINEDPDLYEIWKPWIEFIGEPVKDHFEETAAESLVRRPKPGVKPPPTKIEDRGVLTNVPKTSVSPLEEPIVWETAKGPIWAVGGLMIDWAVDTTNTFQSSKNCRDWADELVECANKIRATGKCCCCEHLVDFTCNPASGCRADMGNVTMPAGGAFLGFQEFALYVERKCLENCQAK